MNEPKTVAAEWPQEGLELLGRCPVCEKTQRTLMFDNLQDRIFFCAPGQWTMYRCDACQSAYLDPRPTLATIGIAYSEYYTHDQTSAKDVAELTWLRRVRRSLANGYRNRRFDAQLKPAWTVGSLMALAFPNLRRLLDRQHRHLPPSPKGRVLDVGFGNGSFLLDAQSIGWEAVGTDVDPKVIASARASNLQVFEGTVDEVTGPFDFVTLAHTIEHFHDPVYVIRRCFQLLSPGGQIWIETPNANACGLRRFGANWRGLEPPRHLVLFNLDSLECVLRDAGFDDVRNLEQPDGLVKGLYAISENIRRRQPPDAALDIGEELRRLIKADDREGRSRPSVREFISLMARKPS